MTGLDWKNMISRQCMTNTLSCWEMQTPKGARVLLGPNELDAVHMIHI